MTGDEGMAMKYGLKADSIKTLVQDKLWNTDHHFFETMRGDASAEVREAIGYIPWYFNLPDASSKYTVAWKEVMDEKGFPHLTDLPLPSAVILSSARMA